MEAPIGRSYIVRAPTRDLAPGAARTIARKEGHRIGRATRILHVERIDAGIYEVVIEAR